MLLKTHSTLQHKYCLELTCLPQNCAMSPFTLSIAEVSRSKCADYHSHHGLRDTVVNWSAVLLGSTYLFTMKLVLLVCSNFVAIYIRVKIIKIR